MSAKSKTIYVVTDGEYSDYHIVGVYSTRELAERCQSATLADNIEEYELDAVGYSLYDAGYRRYHVTFEGEQTYVEQSKMDELAGQCIILFKGTPPRIRVTLYAKDEKYAVKIAADYRAQYIASGQYDLDVAENLRYSVFHDLNDATIPELDCLHNYDRH